MATASAASVHEPGADAYGPGPRSAWMDVDWRRHQSWVKLAARPVNVIELGEGPPVILLHGLAGQWVSWLETIPALARAHRVIALDLPGFGHSPMPAEPISIPGYASIVEELMDVLGIDSAALVGISMGGFIAAELALSRPARVTRLVLVAAVGLSIERRRSGLLKAVARRVAPINVWVGARAERLTSRPGARKLFMRMSAAHPERLPAPLAAEQLKGEGKPGWLDAVDALTSFRIRPRLHQIARPTLIVWGEHDRLVPVRDADEFARAIPHARKVVFADTGHSPQLERPEAFNALLAEFLAPEV